MQQQLEQRLSELKTEYQTGQKMLADLEVRQAELRQTLLRISGAIQVLEEMLDATPHTALNGAVSSEAAMLTNAALV